MSHLVLPNSDVDLTTIPTRGEALGVIEKDAAKKEFKALREELAELQHKWYADGRRKLLIVFQALDAGGKDSSIRNVFMGVNPQGVRVSSFKAPTSEEFAHDYLWRIHKEVPANGMIGVFNRSHYEDVLIVRVLDLVPEDVWRPRYDHINQFEKLLADTGTTILKFYLHISKEEQQERLQDRVDDPTKWWKFDPGDLKHRERWDDYRSAFEEVFMQTSTEVAPWYVVPADQKWYRNWVLTKTIVEKMRELNPQFPEAEGDYSGFVVE